MSMSANHLPSLRLNVCGYFLLIVMISIHLQTSRAFLRRSINCAFPRYIASSYASKPTTLLATASNGVKDVKQEPQAIYPPIKAMIFMDGTWLFYSLLVGRDAERGDPVKDKFGEDWTKKYTIDWNKIPNIIAKGISEQLKRQGSLRSDVEVTRTSVFTSLRSDTPSGCLREQMLQGYYKANFDVHQFETLTTQEKCVDISLAVNMMYMATVPNAYDIAVLVSGDKDFLPALQKTKLLGKRVAICSMRNSCNRFLSEQFSNARDFDMIWIDDNLDQIIIPTPHDTEKEKDVLLLRNIIKKILLNTETKSLTSRELGKLLQREIAYPSVNALTILKNKFQGLKAFIESQSDLFAIGEVTQPEDSIYCFEIKLINRDAVTTEVVEELDDDNIPTYLDKEQEEEEDYDKEILPFDDALVIHSIKDIIQDLSETPRSYVSSRDIGRKLKLIKHDNTDLLQYIKNYKRSLKAFLSDNDDIFDIRLESNVVGVKAFEFGVRLFQQVVPKPAKVEYVRKGAEPTAVEVPPSPQVISVPVVPVTAAAAAAAAAPTTSPDLNELTVKDLKQILKDMGLVTTGNKADLINRILDAASS